MAWFLLAVVFAMFVLDTAMFVIDIRNAIQEISYTLTSNSTLSFADRYALTDNLPWPVQSALYAFLVRCNQSLGARVGNAESMYPSRIWATPS